MNILMHNSIIKYLMLILVLCLAIWFYFRDDIVVRKFANEESRHFREGTQFQREQPDPNSEVEEFDVRKEQKPFLLTNEWQRIGPDQPLQPGFHVRINLKTGEREAKLIDKSENEDSKQITTIEVNDTKGQPQKPVSLIAGLIPEKQNNSENQFLLSQQKTKNDTEEDQKMHFRSYEELKKEMKDLNLEIKTDMEVLLGLMKNLREHTTSLPYPANSSFEDEMVKILTDLEYLLHQVDNAKEFVKQNGVTEIIIPCLKSNSTKIEKMAARALGAASQNNPPVQIAAVNDRVIPILLRIATTSKDYGARTSSLYAVSSLMHSFPYVQYKFVKLGGLDALASFFDDDSGDSKELDKLKLRALSLLYDILVEKAGAEQTLKEASEQTGEKSEAEERVRQYNMINLENILKQSGWCHKLPNYFVRSAVSDKAGVLSSTSEHHIEDAARHEIVDTTLKAMHHLLDVCKDDFKTITDFTDTLVILLEYYRELSLQDDPLIKYDPFYRGIYELIHLICLNLDLPIKQ